MTNLDAVAASAVVRLATEGLTHLPPAVAVPRYDRAGLTAGILHFVPVGCADVFEKMFFLFFIVKHFVENVRGIPVY